MDNTKKSLINLDLLGKDDSDSDESVEIVNVNSDLPKPKLYTRLVSIIEKKIGWAFCILFIAILIILVFGFLIYTDPARH